MGKLVKQFLKYLPSVQIRRPLGQQIDQSRRVCEIICKIIVRGKDANVTGS